MKSPARFRQIFRHYHQVSEQTQDFLIHLLIDQGENTCVSEVMTAPVVTVDKDTNMVVAARMLVERNCHHLPVLGESGKPVGIISTTDFVRIFADRGAALAG